MNLDYAQNYLFIGVLALASIFLGVAPLVLARFVAPKKPGKTKSSPYECGLESTGDSWIQFRMEYYIYALLFVLFDVEVVFLFPWAMVWRGMGLVAFAEIIVFLGILGVGLVYAWKRGLLEWK